MTRSGALWLLSISMLSLFDITNINSVHAEISASEFERLHRELRPSDKEAWRTIPWQTSVLEAQNTAGEQKKPIFIWAMDGHPLGCT